MGWLDFGSHSLWSNVAIFALAGTVVWSAGTRLSRYVNEISERTGMGKAFLGALMLGGITSLPELATTLTASVAGDPELAVNNVFGSIAMNVLLLAVVADVVDGGRALTSLVQKPTLIMQAGLSILVIAVGAAAAMITGLAVWGVGVGSLVLFLTAVVAFYLTHRLQKVERWVPAERAGQQDGEQGADAHRSDDAPARRGARDLSTWKLLLFTATASLGILAAGYFLSRSGSAIADQTGIGSSMGGFVLVAFGTSLPEISTLISSVRLGQFSLVFSEIFGTNIFNSTIIFVADLAYGGSPILQQVGRFSQLAALLGIMLTSVYLVGLVTRSRNTSIGRLGTDSVVVIVLYAAGVVVLHLVRPGG